MCTPLAKILDLPLWSIGGIVHRRIVGSRSIHRGIPVYPIQLFHLPLKDTCFYHRKTKKTRVLYTIQTRPCRGSFSSEAEMCLLIPALPQKDCHLKWLSLNAQSLKRKHKSPRSEMFCQIHAFQKLVYSDKYNIICVTETWLKDFSWTLRFWMVATQSLDMTGLNVKAGAC